jgi:hypothetical protein
VKPFLFRSPKKLFSFSEAQIFSFDAFAYFPQQSPSLERARKTQTVEPRSPVLSLNKIFELKVLGEPRQGIGLAKFIGMDEI